MNAPATPAEPIRIITAHTRGSVCHAIGIVGDEVLEQAIRMRSTPLAKLLAEGVHRIARVHQSWSFEAVVQHARDELEWAVAAQARRRFGSSFARGCG